jgi:hypothetical protein
VARGLLSVAGMTHSRSRSQLLFSLVALLGACGGNGLGIGGGGSGGSGGGGGSWPPTLHRPVPETCPLLVGDCPSGTPDMGQACTSDKSCTAGTHGHCNVIRGGCACAYDDCSKDSDCPANNVCACAATINMPGASNGCVAGNCRVDADCGAGGYCSPSLGMGCIPNLPLQGYFCHTRADSCVNDQDCASPPAGPFRIGHCEWHPEVSHWACTFVSCAG